MTENDPKPAPPAVPAPPQQEGADEEAGHGLEQQAEIRPPQPAPPRPPADE